MKRIDFIKSTVSVGSAFVFYTLEVFAGEEWYDPDNPLNPQKTIFL